MVSSRVMLSGSEASGVTNWWVWPTRMLRCRSA